MNKIVLPLVCALLISGCGQPDNSDNQRARNAEPTSPSESVAPQPSIFDPSVSFDDLYSQAESAVAKAVEKKAIWSATENMLEEALAANIEGRSEAARKLAFEAKMQAELAVAQADREQVTWRSRVLSD